MTIDNTSAIGIETHIPMGPNRVGSTASIPKINANVLKKEMSAEILPFETLVKNTDANILRPANRYPNEKIENASIANEYATLSDFKKIPTIACLNITQSITSMTELIAMVKIDILNTNFVCFLSSVPCAKAKTGATPAPNPIYIELRKNCKDTITVTAAIPSAP